MEERRCFCPLEPNASRAERTKRAEARYIFEIKTTSNLLNSYMYMCEFLICSRSITSDYSLILIQFYYT